MAAVPRADGLVQVRVDVDGLLARAAAAAAPQVGRGHLARYAVALVRHEPGSVAALRQCGVVWSTWEGCGSCSGTKLGTTEDAASRTPNMHAGSRKPGQRSDGKEMLAMRARPRSRAAICASSELAETSSSWRALMVVCLRRQAVLRRQSRSTRLGPSLLHRARPPVSLAWDITGHMHVEQLSCVVQVSSHWQSNSCIVHHLRFMVYLCRPCASSSYPDLAQCGADRPDVDFSPSMRCMSSRVVSKARCPGCPRLTEAEMLPPRPVQLTWMFSPSLYCSLANSGLILKVCAPK